MSLIEIIDLLNSSLHLELQYSQEPSNDLSLIFESPEGKIFGKSEDISLSPLIKALLATQESLDENQGDHEALRMQMAWQQYLTGESSQPPEQPFNTAAELRLLCIYPLTESLHNELLQAFQAILDAHFLCLMDQKAYWLLPSEPSLGETLFAISQSIETEYDSNVRLSLSQPLETAFAENSLYIAYQTLKALTALQADGEALSPAIFEDHTLLLLIREWLNKEQGPIEGILRQHHDFSQLDEETKKTIDMMFRMNLNLTDTAKALFIHRNTLIYRLDKFEKTFGIDLRVFEDAFKLKLLLML